MANQQDIRNLTSEDIQDYWSQFVRFYANATGYNFGPKVPISFLTKKFGNEIIKRYELNVDSVSQYSIKRIVPELIQKGAIEIETTRPLEKFTEKFEKVISKFLSQIDFNQNFKIKFVEQTPYDVGFLIEIDIEDWLKSSQDDKQNASQIYKNLRQFFYKFLGTEYGNPIHGELNFNNQGISILNVDEWLKKVFNKQIKSQIKNSEFASMVQRITTDLSDYHLKLKIITPLSVKYNSRLYNHNGLISFIKNIFSEMGYNSESVSISFS